jgi:hypothetical protein
MFLLFSINDARSQESSATTIVRSNAKTIKLIAARPKLDQKGTRVDTVYTFTVDWQDIRDDKRYTILYYLNNELQFELENQTLPAEIKRNFKGQASGFYDVRVEVEDASLGYYNVVASDTVRIEVK